MISITVDAPCRACLRVFIAPQQQLSDTPTQAGHSLVMKKILVTSYHYLPPVSDTSHLTRSQRFFNQQDPTNHGRMVAGSKTRAISRAHKLIAVSTVTRH